MKYSVKGLTRAFGAANEAFRKTNLLLKQTLET